MMKSKIFLGVSFGFNSSACVMDSQGKVLCAIQQERLNGEKNTKEIPFDAIVRACKEAGVKTIHSVSYSHYQGLTSAELERYTSDKNKCLLEKHLARPITGEQKFLQCVVDLLKENEINVVSKNKILRVEHHDAHANSALAIYGETNDCLIVTSDGFGDGYSGKIFFYDAKSAEKHVISDVKLVNSIALIYQFFTGAMGFREHHHEGKITGLSAHGEPIYLKELALKLTGKTDMSEGWVVDERNLFDLNTFEKQAVELSTITGFEDFLRLKKTIYDFVTSKLICAKTEEHRFEIMKDLSATVQKFAEETITWWLINNVLKNEMFNGLEFRVYLSGGLFANVKLNKVIQELTFVKELRVCPPMGDEGNCIGAAYENVLKIVASNETILKSKIDPYENVICGTQMGDVLETIDENAFLKMKLQYDKNIVSHVFSDEESLIGFVCEHLKNSKIVCWCQGKMEFGPRALCHRSILYNCKDKSTNDWLNKKLGRTEFMPFAPVCRKEDVKSLFFNTEESNITNKFMTITYDCTDEFKENYPAAVHVDGTARPQVLEREDDNLMHDLLTKYFEMTEQKALINTSFNLHNMPIVEDVSTAVNSWLKAELDILVIGNFVFERKK